MASEKTGPNQRGRFEKGVSGNPKGRPKGARNKTTVILEKMLSDDGADVMRSVIEAAKKGDMTAARLVLDRICSVRKGRPVNLPLPRTETPRDILNALSVTEKAMAFGEITPDEAVVISSVLDHKRRAIETVDLGERVTALEKLKEV